jgi:hypothetical protein
VPPWWWAVARVDKGPDSLFLRAHRYCRDAVSALLQHGCRTDEQRGALLAAVDRDGNTALHAAVDRDCNKGGRQWPSVVDVLLQLGGTRDQRQALLAAVNNDGRTALHGAVEWDGVFAADWQTSLHAAAISHRQTALLRAVQNVVAKLLHDCGTDESRRALVAVGNLGFTALHDAARFGSGAMVTLLLPHAGGDVDSSCELLTLLLRRAPSCEPPTVLMRRSPWHDDLLECCVTLVSRGALPDAFVEHMLPNLRRVTQALAARALVPDMASASVQVRGLR